MKALLGILLVVGVAQAAEIQPVSLGVLAKGTRAEAELFAAADMRMFMPVQGCLVPRDTAAYSAALADKPARDRMTQQFQRIIESGKFRQLLAVWTPNAATAKLEIGITSVHLDTIDGPRTAYFPSVTWRDGRQGGAVGFEPCRNDGFAIARKQTRVIREQTVDTLAEVVEPLTLDSGSTDNVTIRVFRANLSVSAPDEQPGTVQLLGDKTSRLCFTAADGAGKELKRFSAYKANSEVKVEFAKMTDLVKSDATLRKALNRYQIERPLKSPVHSRKYDFLLEQIELGLQAWPCTKDEQPFKKETVEWMYLSHK